MSKTFFPFRLLQKFEVVIPLNDEKVLIPSKLPAKPSGFTNRAKNNAIHTDGNLTRYYKFPYIPVGFWARLISRLMLFQSPLQNEAKKVSSQSSGSAFAFFDVFKGHDWPSVPSLLANQIKILCPFSI